MCSQVDKLVRTSLGDEHLQAKNAEVGRKVAKVECLLNIPVVLCAFLCSLMDHLYQVHTNAFIKP
jgi:hypothetical protein